MVAPFVAGGIGNALRLGAAAYSAYNRYAQNRTTGSTRQVGGGGAFVSRRRLRTGRKKRRRTQRVFRELLYTGQREVYRWQQTSPTYLGPGRLGLLWGRTSPLDQAQRMPFHFMSLTSSMRGVEHAEKGCYRNGMNRVVYNSSTGSYYWNPLQPQNFVGDNAGNVLWQPEQNEGGSTTAAATGRVFHEWTDVRLNLYGTYTVPITYTVLIAQMPRQLDPFTVEAGTTTPEGTELHNMFKDWSRKQLYSSVGCNGRSDWDKDVRIVKRYSVTIQPFNYSDQNSETLLPEGYSKSPHIHELRWFLRHDRFRNYKWSENVSDSTLTRDFMKPGWDYNGPEETMADVEWGKRLFLIVLATSPEVQDGVTTDYVNPADPVTQGSYDVCVRNSFRYFV